MYDQITSGAWDATLYAEVYLKRVLFQNTYVTISQEFFGSDTKHLPQSFFFFWALRVLMRVSSADWCHALVAACVQSVSVECFRQPVNTVSWYKKKVYFIIFRRSPQVLSLLRAELILYACCLRLPVIGRALRKRKDWARAGRRASFRQRMPPSLLPLLWLHDTILI